MVVNSLLSPLLIFMLMTMFDLELIVNEPPMLVSTTATFQGFILIGVIYLCIVLTIFQVVVSILAWVGNYRSLVERHYYSFVTAATIDFYMLLGSWGLVIALY